MEFVGKTVKKEVKGVGIVSGTVKSYDPSSGFFEILYEQGDSEELESSDVASLLQLQPESAKAKPRVGRKPKKRRRVERQGDAGAGSERILDGVSKNRGSPEGNVNGSEEVNGVRESLREEIGLEDSLNKSLSRNVSCVKDGLDLNARLNLDEDLNLNDGCSLPLEAEDGLKRRDCIDLNLDVSNEDDVGGPNVGHLGSGAEAMQRECNFDLNVEVVCEDGKETRCDDLRNGHSEVGNVLFGKMGLPQKEEIYVNNSSVQGGGINGNLNHAFDAVKLEGIHVSFDHPSKDGSWCLVEENGGASRKEDAGAIDSLQISSAISVRDSDFGEAQQVDCPSEGGIAIIHKYQDDAGTPCKQEKFQDVPGSPRKRENSRRKRRKLSDNPEAVPETVLRRSSRRASAIKQVSSIVEVEVADDDPLVTLGTDALTEEKPLIPGSQKSEQYDDCPKYKQYNNPLPKLQLPPSSTNLNLDDVPVLELFSIYACFRSFSTLLFLSPFELEDLVAALKSEIPRFKTGFDLKRLMFITDYYKQPVIVKVEILQYLCDEMIESEAIRSELNRRSLVAETDMGFDQNMYFDSGKKRRAVMDVSGGSCLTEENVDDTTDWNSDECCLCKMDGSLICCDGCPAAFHSRCVGIASDKLPEGDWYCPECGIGKHRASMKSRRSLRGADLLGMDMDGSVYFNSCGYLLVSSSSEAGPLFYYYHQNDIHIVIEALKSMHPLYGGILMAIYKHWDIRGDLSLGDSVLNQISGKNMQMKGEYSTLYTSLAPFTSETCLNKKQANDQGKLDENSTIDCCMRIGQDFPKVGNCLDSTTTIESHCVASDGSADTTQTRTGINNVQMYGLNDFSRCNESLNQPGVPERLHPDCSLTSSSLDVGHKINLRSVGASSTPSPDSKDTSEAPCGIDYVNYYSFARTASFVAQELMCKLPEKTNKILAMSEEEFISDQAKVIMKKSTNFCWPSIPNLDAAAQKEKCGWCFTCKAANEDRDCLFNSVVKPVWEVPNNTLVGLQPRNIQNGHLRDIICLIFSLEVRLRGLLLGPWLNLHQTNLWHKDLLTTSDFIRVKRLLLLLESNLRPFALSADWLKHVDSVPTMGSAVHIVVSRTSSRHGIGKKRVRNSDTETSSSSNGASGLGMYWWRGGRLSRKLFNLKALPHSLVTKAARQGGCNKIPGILYLENSDFARRSRFVAWRAAVEMSTSAEQLALQIRELYSNIRWLDIENNHPLCVLDKESRKSVRLFKKSIVRRKCTEGQSVKYLLDFGKRRAMPDVVIKHGSLLEQSSSERKKYWLEESYVPMHLLKNFEERRIVRKSTDKKLGKVLEIGRVNKKIPQERGFSYLFTRLERSNCHQCAHCNKVVSMRDAVRCLHCKGYFHKRHVRKSGGTRTTGSTYSCHKCQDGLHAKTNTNKRKVDSKLQKIQAKKRKTMPSVCKSVNLKGNKKALSKVRQVRSRNSKNIQSSVPLRRSTRKAKSLYMQSQMNGGRKKGKLGKKNVGRKKGKQSKSKKVASPESIETTGECTKLAVTTRRTRTKFCSSYWLNGLQLSRKPNDERVMLFKEKKTIVSSEDFSGSLDCLNCCLCCGNGRTLNYIACEICGDWFHGDAFGLNVENVKQLIGFKCHVCIDRTAPICPHMKLNALSRPESNAANECAEELCNPVSLQPLSEVQCRAMNNCFDHASAQLPSISTSMLSLKAEDNCNGDIVEFIHHHQLHS
ncbi:hypothetical protein ACSQ67_022118 [Phaseolus vulgaris]